MLCSKCKRKVKIDWGYFVEIKGKTKKYLKKMQELETKILRSGTADNTNEYYREYSELFNENGADVVNEYPPLP